MSVVDSVFKVMAANTSNHRTLDKIKYTTSTRVLQPKFQSLNFTSAVVVPILTIYLYYLQWLLVPSFIVCSAP